MKVGIITFSDRNTTPYLKYYEDVMKREVVSFECIFWDRYSNYKTTKNKNEYTVHVKCLPGANKFGKILPMLKYKYIVEKIIKKERYTHLIILTTLPGVLLNKILLKEFKNKYILDIRDYTYEKYEFYKKIVDELVDKSYFTAISSKGFMKFLNKNKKIIPCHNISNLEYGVDICDDLKNKKSITIGFVGAIRYFKQDCKLINCLANSEKYILSYIGKFNIDCNLKDYCKKNNINNVIFKGEFKNEDKPLIYRKIDLINSIYGCKGFEVTTLLPNRLYDGVIFKKPIIASKRTFLGELVEKFSIGIAVDLNKNVSEDITIFINNFNDKKFIRACDNFLSIAQKEQQVFINRICDFVKVND